MQIETLPRITASHLIKSVDLNHHGTLYAGRMAEWLVEVGFMTARATLQCPPQNIVCVRLHGMEFHRSVTSGDTIVMEGQVAYVGRSSVTIYVRVHSVIYQPGDALFTEGLATFVHVHETKPAPHGLTVERPTAGEAQRLWDMAVADRERKA